MSLNTLVDDFVFNGAINPSATPVDGPWKKTVTGAGGVTVAAENGKMKLALDATNEVQNLCLSFNDQLAYKIDDLLLAEFWVDVSTSLDASVQIAVGMASARNNVIDSIASAALFRCIGSNSLVIESDDTVNDKDDIATGTVIGTTMKKLSIDFASGVQTVAPPGLSKGGKGSVIFGVENGQDVLRRVGANDLFDMSNYSGGLQPFIQIQKTVGVAVGHVQIRRVRISYRFQP